MDTSIFEKNIIPDTIPVLGHSMSNQSLKTSPDYNFTVIAVVQFSCWLMREYQNTTQN